MLSYKYIHTVQSPNVSRKLWPSSGNFAVLMCFYQQAEEQSAYVLLLICINAMYGGIKNWRGNVLRLAAVNYSFWHVFSC